MKKTTILLVGAFFCLNFCAKAQEIKPLKVGDQVPESILQQSLQVINAKAKGNPLKLSAYQGKAIILDFWGSWCGTCISRFPHIDSLNKVYKKDLQFVLVNTSSRDADPKKVAHFIKGYLKGAKDFTVPFTHQNKGFNQAFYARALPHYVWIGRDGVIKAITDWTEVKQENINPFINGLPINLPIKLR